MTQPVFDDLHVGAVQPWDACRPDDPCPHCKADRPAAPIEVGDPRDLTCGNWELDDVLRQALPPAFHRPVWIDTCTPKGWFCACCWDEAEVTQWPCAVAYRHGNYVSRSWKFEFELARKHQLVIVAGGARQTDLTHGNGPL